MKTNEQDPKENGQQKNQEYTFITQEVKPKKKRKKPKNSGKRSFVSSGPTIPGKEGGYGV
mgnify:CR=1 FL=1